MANEQLLQDAEREVIIAARDWFYEASWHGRDLTPAESKLRSAIYMMNRARSITGTDIKVIKPK
jgi:hypothetical protein